MELIKGTCFFCANSKVVSDYESVHSTIITLFSGKIKEEKLINLTPPKVCPLCYHSFVLMKRTHDDILHSSSAEKVHENCHLCGNSEDVINVSKWAHFKDIGKDFPCSNTDVISNVCSDCLYYLETKSTVKEKLLSEYPVLKQESVISQFEVLAHSTPTRRTRTKAERKSPVDIIDLVERVPTEMMKFRPLKNDKHLRRSKNVNTDPKLLNQVLIIKLPNKLEEPVKPRKSSTPKRVRFQDVDEHIIDRYNSPSLFTDKENTYKDTEELVEYEIKTSPRKSRYRDVDDFESNIDSLDPRKKSFFKIKLMKKKPKSIIVKPNRDAPKYPVERHKLAFEKRREAIDKRRTASPKPNNLEELVKKVCKYNLVVNLDRMILPETNGVYQTDSSLDELDPLRIDSWEDTSTTVANAHNNKQSKTKTKTILSKKRPKRGVECVEDKLKKETNGYIESKKPKLKQNQTKKEENIRNTRTRNRTVIVSVSSEEDFKPKEIKPKVKPSLRKRRATICVEDSNVLQEETSVNGTGEKESDVEILAAEITKPVRKRRAAIKRKKVKTTKEIKSAKGVSESKGKGFGVEIRAADSSVTEQIDKIETESEEDKGQEDGTVTDSNAITIDADDNSGECEKAVESSEKEDENERLNNEAGNVQNDDLVNEIMDNDTDTEKINELRSAPQEDDKMDDENLDKVENIENEKQNTLEKNKTESSNEEAAIRLEVSDTDQKADNETSDEADKQTQNEKEVIDQDENKSDNEISDKEDRKLVDENEVEEDEVQDNENSEQEADQTGNTNPDKVEDIEDKTGDEEVTTADEDTTANEVNTADEESTADDANTADEENAADDEVNTADDEVNTADEENAVGEVNTADEEIEPDNNDEAAADEVNTADEDIVDDVNTADEEIADDANTADEETTADEDNTANDSTQAEENTETEEIDSQDASMEQSGEATEEALSHDIEENNCKDAADEDQDAADEDQDAADEDQDAADEDQDVADEEEATNYETTDNGEQLDETKEEEFDDVCNTIEATLASFERISDVNEESEIVNLDTTIESQDSEVTGEKRKRSDSEDNLSNESSSDSKRKKVTYGEKFVLSEDV